MRISCDPLCPDPADRLPISDAAGRTMATLWRQRIAWSCSDGALDILVLADQPFPLPAPESTEPIAGALARLHRAVAPAGGLLLLPHPAQVFTPERIALAAGVRLFGFADEADLACWDAALAAGLPVFGVRGTVVTSAVRPDALAMLSALAYGNVLCEEGLHLRRCDETPQGVDIAADEELEATVVIRGGFEAARLTGRELRWRDQGHEGSVRLVVRGPSGTCWTQPRFVAPPGKAHGHH